MAGLPAHSLEVSQETGNIYLCLFEDDAKKGEVIVSKEDITEKCLRAVFGHLAITCDKSGTGRVYMNLMDPIGRRWQMSLARVMDNGRVATE